LFCITYKLIEYFFHASNIAIDENIYRE